jgi:hypothetical protein
MKKCLLFGFIGLYSVAVAQKRADSLKSPSLKYQQKITFQVEGGTQGVGGDLRYSFSPGWAGRFGANFLPVDASDIFDIRGFQESNQLSARFSNIHLLAEFTPFKANWFRLVGGAGYLIKGDGNFEITPDGTTYDFGNTTLTADQLGKLNVDVSWKGVAPYLGVGFFNAIPLHAFSINFDIGSYYLSSPNAAFAGTKLLADNNSQQAQVNENLKNYRFFPVLQLNFNFKIH